MASALELPASVKTKLSYQTLLIIAVIQTTSNLLHHPSKNPVTTLLAGRAVYDSFAFRILESYLSEMFALAKSLTRAMNWMGKGLFSLFRLWKERPAAKMESLGSLLPIAPIYWCHRRCEFRIAILPPPHVSELKKFWHCLKLSWAPKTQFNVSVFLIILWLQQLFHWIKAKNYSPPTQSLVRIDATESAEKFPKNFHLF